MIHVTLEGIRAILSSISFGMDDKYDRLTRRTTTLMVLFGAVIIASNRFFGLPISCATTELPNGVSQHWVDTLCWMTDKKFAPIQIVGNSHSRKPTSFYQFTVETLMLITLLLYVPGKIWLFVLGQSGYNLRTISTLIAAIKQTVGCQRMTNIKELASHLQISRRYHRVHRSFDEDLQRRLAHLRLSTDSLKHCRHLWYQNRYFIPIIYVLIKIVYIIVLLLVYVLLEYCLGFKYIYLGFPILNKIGSGNTSTFLDERFFPQRTWCLISRPKLGGTDETWADCVLPINIINNIIFSLLWFWLIVVLFFSIYGLFRAVYKMRPSSTQLFLGHHLRAYDLYTLRDNAVISDFIRKCPSDVILILRLYEIELGNTLVGEIVGQLFLMHKKSYISRENSFVEDLP